MLRSFLNAEVDVAAAALSCGRLADAFAGAIETMPHEEVRKCCAKLVQSLANAQTDNHRGYMANVIRELVTIEEGCSAMIAVGACAAVVEALKRAENVAREKNCSGHL